MNALATARRHGRLAITLLALAGAACSSAPRRDQIEPVTLPDNLGERRLVGHDTLWVVSGRSWEVASPVQGPLRAAQVALDDAAREYRRYWDDDPPLVRVVIDTLAPRPAASAAAESRDGRAAPPMGAMMGEHLSYALEAGTRVVHLSMPAPAAQPASRERDGRGASRPMMLPVGPAVVHAWLWARADRAASAANVGASESAETALNDPRIPDWVEVGLATLIVQPGSHDALGAMLARQKLIPLDSLFRMSGPVLAMGGGAMRGAREGREREGEYGGGGMRGGGRRGGMGGMRGGMGGGMGGPPGGENRRANGAMGLSLFPLESAGFAEFVVEREGGLFLGRLADALMAGAPMRDALANARQLSSDPATLQKAFEIWLSSFSPQMGGPGGRRRG